GQGQAGLVLEVDGIQLDAFQVVAGAVPDIEHGVVPGESGEPLEGVGVQGGAGGQGEGAGQGVAPVGGVQDEHDSLLCAAGIAQVDGGGQGGAGGQGEEGILPDAVGGVVVPDGQDA